MSERENEKESPPAALARAEDGFPPDMLAELETMELGPLCDFYVDLVDLYDDEPVLAMRQLNEIIERRGISHDEMFDEWQALCKQAEKEGGKAEGR